MNKVLLTVLVTLIPGILLFGFVPLASANPDNTVITVSSDPTSPTISGLNVSDPDGIRYVLVNLGSGDQTYLDLACSNSLSSVVFSFPSESAVEIIVVDCESDMDTTQWSAGFTGAFEQPLSTPDSDVDFVPDLLDNCDNTPNPDQADNDGDNIGDVCDPDNDNDGRINSEDNCPFDSNPDQEDQDGDFVGDPCDPFDSSQVCGAGTVGDNDLQQCIGTGSGLSCGLGTIQADDKCVSIIECGSGTMLENNVCQLIAECEELGSMIGGALMDIDTVALLVASIGVNPVITGLVGITIAGVSAQAVWFIHKRRK